MRRLSKFKFYLETICGYILVFIMLGAGLQLLYTGLNTSLDKASEFQGRIQEIGVIRSKPSTSRFKVTILKLKQFTFRQLLMGIIALTAGLFIGWRISRKVYYRMQPTTHQII